MVRVQDVSLTGRDDRALLEWAAREGRIVLTSDVSTLVGYAYDRVKVGDSMPGVFVIPQGAPLGPVIDDLLLLVNASTNAEWERLILYLPL